MKKNYLYYLILVIGLTLTSCSSDFCLICTSSNSSSSTPSIVKKTITSTSITNNTEIGINYVGNYTGGRTFIDAKNQSPHLNWGNTTDNVKSSIILAYDTHANANNHIHWLRVNISGTKQEVAKGTGSTVNMSNGFSSWYNPTIPDTQERKYYGPQNPDHGTAALTHTYRFAIFGIDKETITLPANYTNQTQLTDQLRSALESNTIYNINNNYDGTTTESFKVLSVGYIDVTY